MKSENSTFRQPRSVTAFSVATARYFDFWREMATSADRNFFPQSQVTLTVFTDREVEARDFAKSLSRISVDVRPIAHLGWPNATLLRYELMDKIMRESESEVCAHLDADLIIRSSVGAELSYQNWTGGLALVRHPYFSRKYYSYLRLSRYPNLLITELKHRIKSKGLFGSWETNSRSMAFVPFHQRKIYVCGGVWFGRRTEFAKMVKVLANRVDTDAKNGIVAKWHDESHLNWFAANTQTTLLPSSYCGTIESELAMGQKSLIVAVDKGAMWRKT